MPPAFWVVLILLAGALLRFKKWLQKGLAIPMFAVLGTIGIWYVGDAFYNDYGGYFVPMFQPEILSAAWWQVAWFLVVFLFLAPMIHRRVNARCLNRPSFALYLFKNGVDHPRFQKQINLLLFGCVVVWLVLVGIAAIRLESQIIYYFFPFLGEEKADPWGRDRLGGGYDSLLSVAGHVQLFTGACFGVVAAVSTNRIVRTIAIVGCLLTWPYYIFDRVRNTMLAVMLPAIVMWVFFRLRGSLLKKVSVLTPFFLAVSFWFAFVISNRSDTTITEALSEKGVSISEVATTHHDGLNMFEELCWINTLIKNGTYQPNWGENYFSELVNPIPRSIFPDKPMIGLDYAMARGQGSNSSDGSDVTATIATGLIGQGVVNFGVIAGPAFGAFLISLWVAVLAHLDLNGEKFGRIPLFALGLTLTFNLGRDITFLTLYTFVFGAVLIWITDIVMGEKFRKLKARRLSKRKSPPRSQSEPESVDSAPKVTKKTRVNRFRLKRRHGYSPKALRS